MEPGERVQNSDLSKVTRLSLIEKCHLKKKRETMTK